VPGHVDRDLVIGVDTAIEGLARNIPDYEGKDILPKRYNRFDPENVFY